MVKKHNSKLNREKTIFEKVEFWGGKTKIKATKNIVLLEISGLTKSIIIPIVYSHYPHAIYQGEQKKIGERRINKLTFKIV